MHSILASRINQLSNPLFPPLEFKCKWLDNVRAYVAGGMTEPYLLTFAAHDFLKTARTSDRTDRNGLLGFDFTNRLRSHLPERDAFKVTQTAFEEAIRLECSFDVPGIADLHKETPLAIIIDTYRRYGATNAYGAADPTPLEKRNAGRHFQSAIDDHLFAWANSDIDNAEHGFSDMCAKLEASLDSIANAYGQDIYHIISSAISDAQDIRNSNKIRY
jgi:hypothetical protein